VARDVDRAAEHLAKEDQEHRRPEGADREHLGRSEDPQQVELGHAEDVARRAPVPAGGAMAVSILAVVMAPCFGRRCAPSSSRSAVLPATATVWS
jgi:hypothetical protein